MAIASRIKGRSHERPSLLTADRNFTKLPCEQTLNFGRI